MSSFRNKLGHELRELIPVTLYFFVAFQLLVITQALMLEQYGISAWSFTTATVGALIVAKVVVIADHFSFVNRFPRKPLIYNIAWKTAIYFVGSILVRYLEHIIHFWRKSGSLKEANRLLLEEVVWTHVLAVQMWLLVLLFVFCLCRELIRALGRDHLTNLVFKADRGAEAPSAIKESSHDILK